MRHVVIASLLGLLLVCNLVAAEAPKPAPTPSVPRGVDDPQAYAQLVDRAIATREKRSAYLADMQKKLKELSAPGLDEKKSQIAKRDLMMQRRLIDIEAERAKHDLEIYWLERSIPPKQRAEFVTLPPAEQTALLETRSSQLRLAVPLAPQNFSATAIENVLAYVQQETEVRIVADWPSLTAVGMKKGSPVSVEIGRYNRPAIDTLKSVVELMTQGKGMVDLSWPDAAVITTEAGMKDQLELQRKLVNRVFDRQAWEGFATPLEPVSLEQVPLADALLAGLGKTNTPPIYVDWAGLAEAGITPATPVDLRLGVHSIGQRLTVLAEAVADRAKVREHDGMKFDVHPVGEIILSTGEGYRRISQQVNRITGVARADDARAALQGRLPEVVLNQVSLQDTMDFFRDATQIDIRADWNTLGASGLTPQTLINQKLYNVPLGFALAMAMEVPPGKPPVVWEIGDGKIVAHGGR
jgi:hypothetical protein